MDKEYIILLKDFKFGKCGLVNQFLIDNKLDKDLRVVLAEYERPAEAATRNGIKLYPETLGRATVKERCIGLEVVNEKKAFYYQLKGHKKLEQQIREYDR